MKRVNLLTGRPGSGKTTLIKRLVASSDVSAGGFYTEEMRHESQRQGFRLVTLDGESAVLAGTDVASPYRVSKYGVSISALEDLGIPAITAAARADKLVVIDEIGKMELFSTIFRQTLVDIINSGSRVLGTIMSNHHPDADAIKQLAPVRLIEITTATRDHVFSELSAWLTAEVLSQ